MYFVEFLDFIVILSIHQTIAEFEFMISVQRWRIDFKCYLSFHLEVDTQSKSLAIDIARLFVLYLIVLRNVVLDNQNRPVADR